MYEILQGIDTGEMSYVYFPQSLEQASEELGVSRDYLLSAISKAYSDQNFREGHINITCMSRERLSRTAYKQSLDKFSHNSPHVLFMQRDFSFDQVWFISKTDE